MIVWMFFFILVLGGVGGMGCWEVWEVWEIEIAAGVVLFP